MSAEIESQIIEYVKKELAGNKPDLQLDRDTDLVGIIDSTAVMEAVVWIESNFGFDVEIDDITPENFGSVSALATYIAGNRKN